MGASVSTLSANTPDTTGQERVCPLCPLHCDDLGIDLSGGHVVVTSGGCALTDRFADSPSQLDATIGGKPTQRIDALMEAAKILNGARSPMVSGLAADIEGLRSAVAIADKISAVVDHADSDGFFNNLNVLQRRGALYTTPAEVRNRADVAVLLGTDFWERLPRFFDRYFPAGPTLFDPAPKPRKIFVLGGATTVPEVPGAEIIAISAKLDQAPELALVLSAMMAGRSVPLTSAAGVAKADLDRICEALKAAQYGIIGWDPGALGPHGDLAVEALYDLIQTINLTHRAAGLPFPANGHVVGASQVCLWQSGTSLRTSFASGTPHYDPRLYPVARQLEEGRVDAVLWLASLPNALPKKSPTKPWVLVSAFAPPEGITPDVFIPVSIPARDHAAVFFRGDGVVSVHATPWGAKANPPSAAQTLDALAQLLTEREAASC